MTQREQRTHKGAQRLSAHNLQFRKNLCANVSYCTYVSYIVKSIEQRISTHNLQLRKYLCVLCAYVVKSNETNFKKNIIYACFLAITTLFSQAQTPNTFSEFYMGFYVQDIVELPNDNFLFAHERNDYHESRGIRFIQIDDKGKIVDSISFFINEYFRISELLNDAFAKIDDSTFVCGVKTRNFNSERNTKLMKISVKPNIDTVKTVDLNISYPDSFYTWNQWRVFEPKTIINLKNNNLMVIGELFGNDGLQMPYFIKFNQDLDIVNTFYVFDSTFSYNIHSVKELHDGTFIFSGQVFHYGSIFNPSIPSFRAVIARIDTNGQFIWRDIIRHGAPSNRNFYVSDRPATFDIAADSTIGLAYFQHLACPDSATSNSCGRQVPSNVIIGRYRFLSYDLDGNVVLDKALTSSQTVVMRRSMYSTDNIKHTPNGDGYIFAGNYIGALGWNTGFIMRLDENGDSVWLREPRPRLSNPFEDFLKIHLARQTSDGGFVGVGINLFLLSLATQISNMSRSFVFKLDSNGCYEPGICPNSMLGVDERVFSSVDGVKIYPNPAERILFVELEGIRGECRVVLRNMQGQSISTQSLDDTYGRNAKTEFDVQHIAAGMYLIEVHGEQGLLHTKKVVIK